MCECECVYVGGVVLHEYGGKDHGMHNETIGSVRGKEEKRSDEVVKQWMLCIVASLFV